jgi:ATPase subunit of ABC transporter with duplicated ATPase domains
LTQINQSGKIADGQELIMMGGKQVNSRAYLSRFNFGGGEQNKKISALSGGERNAPSNDFKRGR